MVTSALRWLLYNRDQGRRNTVKRAKGETVQCRGERSEPSDLLYSVASEPSVNYPTKDNWNTALCSWQCPSERTNLSSRSDQFPWRQPSTVCLKKAGKVCLMKSASSQVESSGGKFAHCTNHCTTGRLFLGICLVCKTNTSSCLMLPSSVTSGKSAQGTTLGPMCRLSSLTWNTVNFCPFW